jgi:hypothetical protein
VGRYLDIATSATQPRSDEATGYEVSGGFDASESKDDAKSSGKGDDGAVFFAVDPRQRNRRLLENCRGHGEESETSEKRSGEVPPRCLHGKTVVECALCSGYARWLIAGGDARIAEARRNPEAARRAFWREAATGARMTRQRDEGIPPVGYPPSGRHHAQRVTGPRQCFLEHKHTMRKDSHEQ